MRSIDRLNAKQILSLSSAEELFSRAPLDARREYRALVMKWHPDHSKTPESDAVFHRIIELYRQAQKKQLDGTWLEPHQKAEEAIPGIKTFLTRESRALKQIHYISTRRFELGTMYIGDHNVTFSVDNEFTDIFHIARKRIRQLRFKNEAMAIEMSKYLPQIEDIFQTDGANVLCLRKTPDQLLLADVLEHSSMKIEPIEHAGWILNVLLNITCYLEWSGLSHNAISTDTVFISPLRHSGMLLGGWWYASELGEDLKALPDRSMNSLPAEILIEKKSVSRIDLELVKSLGREILGAHLGAILPDDSALPRTLRNWLNAPAGESAVADYRYWKYDVLENCFGEPHFVPMNIERKHLYKEI